MTRLNDPREWAVTDSRQPSQRDYHDRLATCGQNFEPTSQPIQHRTSPIQGSTMNQNQPSRYRAFLLFMLIAMTCVPGCNSGQDTAGANGSAADSGTNGKSLTIAVIPKCTGGEFWETVEQGARAAASDLSIDLKWEGTLTETEIAEQNQIIENMINLDVDGMAIAPLNAKATSKPIVGAVDAGIPVVVFDSAVNGTSHTSFVATNNQQGGTLGAEKMIELLGGNQGDIVIMRFVQGTASTEARVEGFAKTIKDAGFKVLADPYSEDGTVAGAKKTAANTLEGLVKDQTLAVDGIFTCNLISALGMAAALDDLRKSGVAVDAKVIGFDTSPKLIQGLQEGTIDALVAQDPKRMGYLAVETVVKHLRDEPIEEYIDTGVQVVTRDRLEDAEIRKLVGLE